jgi:hypothetical protein
MTGSNRKSFLFCIATEVRRKRYETFPSTEERAEDNAGREYTALSASLSRALCYISRMERKLAIGKTLQVHIRIALFPGFRFI